MALNYHRDGLLDSQHPPVLLLHGLFGSLDNLGTIARALYAQFDVISVDLPNHGRSAHSTELTYPQMVKAVLALMDELTIERFIVLGHSMGGKVAMDIAIESPERVSKLIVADIAPVAYEPKHNTVMKALQSVDLAQITKRSQANEQLELLIAEPGVRSFLLKSLAKTDEGFQWRFNLKTIVEQYPNISIGLDSDAHYDGPTLFIKGSNSDYIDAIHRPAIIKYFPKSKAHIVNDAGHWLHAEKPDIFNRIVQRFLLA